MKFYRPFGFILLLFLGMNISLAMAADEWIRLGSVRASLSSEKAMFKLDGTRNFNKIRFQIEGGDISLIKTKVHFGNKQAVMEGFQKLIKAGGTSRAIPLSMPKQQAIQTIELFFNVRRQTVPSTEARIILQGVPAS